MKEFMNATKNLAVGFTVLLAFVTAGAIIGGLIWVIIPVFERRPWLCIGVLAFVILHDLGKYLRGPQNPS